MTTPDKPRTTDAADTSTTSTTPSTTPDCPGYDAPHKPTHNGYCEECGATTAPALAPDYSTRLTPNGYDRYVTAPDGKPAGYIHDAALHVGWAAHDTPRRYTASAPSGLILGYYPNTLEAAKRVAEHDRYARDIPTDDGDDAEVGEGLGGQDAPIPSVADQTSTDLPCDGTGWVCGRCDHKRSDGHLLDFHDGPETAWLPLPYVERVGDHTCQVCETTAPGFRRLYGYWELPNTMVTTTATDATRECAGCEDPENAPHSTWCPKYTGLAVTIDADADRYVIESGGGRVILSGDNAREVAKLLSDN